MGGWHSCRALTRQLTNGVSFPKEEEDAVPFADLLLNRCGLELASFVIYNVLCKHRAAHVRYSCPDALFDCIWKYMCNSLGGLKLTLLWISRPSRSFRLRGGNAECATAQTCSKLHDFSPKTVPCIPQCLHVIKLCRTWMFYILELQHKSMAYLIMCCHALSILSLFFFPLPFSVCRWVKREVWSLEYFSHGPSYVLKFKQEVFSCTLFLA